jgi:hypothetical protein
MKYRLLSVLMLGALLMACSRQESPASSQEAVVEDSTHESAAILQPDLDLYERIFRTGLPHKQADHYVIFLSIGRDPKTKFFGEPPKGFMYRFLDLPHKVHPVSEASLLRDDQGELMGIKEMIPGKFGIILFIEVGKKTEQEILLWVGDWQGPPGGSSSEIRATRKNGTWNLTFTGKGLIS